MYCPGTKQINLEEYLSEDALTEGHFQESFSGGDGVFQPEIDEDGEYLYIAGNDECYDTAVFTVREILPSIADLDTIHLCSGGQIKTGFLPGKFNNILWWDGSTGDSILVREDMDVKRYVEITYEECQIKVPVVILVSDAGAFAGQDTTIMYCQESPEIDLISYLSSAQGNDIGSIYPALKSGELIFTPGVDPAGVYQYIVNTGGCADTTTLTLEESVTQELPFGPIYRCTDQDVNISLPAGEYEKIKWWNGDADDSTVLTGRDFGPFYVEVQIKGCHFRTDFDVITKDAGGFPGIYPDTLDICPGEHRDITIEELDSIRLNGVTYVSGELMTFSKPGKFNLLGFTGECSVKKVITVTTAPDPSDSYHQTISGCEDTPLTILLPKDSVDWIFSWTVTVHHYVNVRLLPPENTTLKSSQIIAHSNPVIPSYRRKDPIVYPKIARSPFPMLSRQTGMVGMMGWISFS